MTLSEFDLIRTFFTSCGSRRPDVVLGVGDDAALLRLSPGQELAVTQDTLVEGVHFFPGTDPEGLGHKALAVNLSDLAAMGATPCWVTLSLTLPAPDRPWLTAFSRGFCALAAEHGVSLVGGDTTRGPLSISVCAHGTLPAGAALRRDAARAGEGIWVTGTLGDAGLALRRLLEPTGGNDPATPLRCLERPQPRVSAGLALRGRASAAIDISDGLLADLGHMVRASGVGAVVHLPRLPLSPSLADWVAHGGDWALPLTAGDDYELCFTLPGAADAGQWDLPCPVSCIGEITPAAGIRVLDGAGEVLDLPRAGYTHFDDHA